MALCHSFDLKSVQSASLDLISKNAEHLIRYIYSHKDEEPYTDSRVRVGLVLKTLFRSADSESTVTVDHEVIAPALDDLTRLLARTVSKEQKQIYMDELTFLERCTQLEELITLNTKGRAT
jgi:hypothetical protein